MNELSRLKMRCRRGMKELDVIFARYLEAAYPTADASEKQCLEELLDLQDPILFNMLLGLEPAPEHLAGLIQRLRRPEGEHHA